MNQELADLLEQRKNIEMRIRELKHSIVRCGNAKIDVEHYPTDKPDRHYAAVLYKPIEGKCRWVSIASAKDRESVLTTLPGIINDLSNLLSNEENCDTIKP